MSKNNVHPDHYKVAGRDRQDDAAAARFVRSITAKTSSQQRPDRMTKGPYFQRPEPAPPASAGRPPDRAQKKSASPAGTAKKLGTRKVSPPSRSAATRKAASTRRKTGRTAKPATKKK
jgi:hypothetical protein